LSASYNYIFLRKRLPVGMKNSESCFGKRESSEKKKIDAFPGLLLKQEI
jgi:hypothetical protein